MSKVITGLTRWSYLHALTPKAAFDGSPEKYSGCFLVPKTDTKTIEKIRRAISEAYEEGKTKFGKNIPPLESIKQPLRDGDIEKPDDPNYKGMYFFNASSKDKPGIVDKDLNPVIDPSLIYSGVWGRVSISTFCYNYNGNKGIGVNLNNLQYIKPDEPLGGRASAESDFANDDADDDFLA